MQPACQAGRGTTPFSAGRPGAPSWPRAEEEFVAIGSVTGQVGKLAGTAIAAAIARARSRTFADV